MTTSNIKDKDRRVKVFTNNCVNKTTFYTLDKAHKTAKRAKRDRDAVIKPYKCPFCHLYHLTSKSAEEYWES